MGKLLFSVYRRSRELDVSRLAAHCGFFLVLSVFPGLVLLMHFLNLWGLGGEQLLRLLETALPDALTAAVRALVGSADARAPLLGLSAVTALWSAGKGMDGLRTGLEAVCRQKNHSGWFRQRLQAAAYTLALLPATAVVLALSLLFPWLRYLLGLLVSTGLYRFLPNRRRPLGRILPGGFLAWLGMGVFSWGFSLYASVSGLFGIYGSVYILALGMLWLYGCLMILLAGGILNEILWENMSEP